MARGTLRIRVVGDARNFTNTLNRTGAFIGRWARRAALALGAAMVGGVALSIRAFANFDQAMTNSLAIMGDVSDVMRDDMARAARDVATTTQFSAVEAAESYFFLASAGLDAAQSIEALPKVAAFAQAGQFDMARATDLLTDAQSALGLAVDDAAQNIENMARVGDVLVKANTLANASVEQFSEALTQKAGAAMRALNMDIEEGVAILSVYADAGVKGSEAGTRLNATLEGITRTARLNADAYESLNVAVFDSQGELRNMADIIGDLEVAFDGMSTEQKLAELATLGLTRQARDGMLQLLDSSDAIRAYEADLREAGGTTQDVADRQMQTFWAQLGLLKDQFIEVGLSIGETLMPHLMNFVGWVQDQMPNIQRIIEGVIDVFRALFGSARDEASGVHESWSRDLPASVGVVDSWARDIQPGVDAAGGALGSIADFIENRLIPAFQKIRDWWDRNGPAIVGAVNKVRDGISSAVDAINVELEVSRDAAIDNADEWVELHRRQQNATAVFGDAWRRFSDGFRMLIGRNKRDAREWGLSFERWARWAASNAVRTAEIIGGVFAVIGTAMQSVGVRVDGMRRLWDNRLGLMALAIARFRHAVGEQVNAVVDWFRRLPDRVRAAVMSGVPGMVSAGRELAAGVLRGLINMGPTLAARARRWVQDNVIAPVRGALRAMSPSREGMDIGANFAESIALGMGDSAVLASRAADDIADRMKQVRWPAVSPSVAVSGGDGAALLGARNGAGVVWTGDVHVHGTVIAERDLAETVRRELIQVGRRNESAGLN